MSTNIRKPNLEATLTVAEYIFKNPGQSVSQILKVLKNSVSRIDFSIAEDILIDSGLIYRKMEKTKEEGKEVFGPVYRPAEGIDLENVRQYINSQFPS